MPVLKSYSSSSGYYILASVRGSVITFQLNDNGFKRLADVGVGVGDRFGLKLLADLTRQGDAFTRKNGTSYHEAEQFEFTFDITESKESEDLFPVCALTGEFADLHLVAHRDGEDIRAILLAPVGMAQFEVKIQLSVPLSILTSPVLDSLEISGHLPHGCQVVESLRQWFRKEVSAEWGRLRRNRNAGRQQALVLDNPDELKLQ